MVWGTLWKYLKRGLESKLNRQVRDPAPQTPEQMDRRQAGQAHGGKGRGRGGDCGRGRSHLPAGVQAPWRATPSYQTGEPAAEIRSGSEALKQRLVSQAGTVSGVSHRGTSAEGVLRGNADLNHPETQTLPDLRGPRKQSLRV